MPENNPTLPIFTMRKDTEPTTLQQKLKGKSQEMAERSRKETPKKEVATDQADLPPAVQHEQPKRRVVRPKKKNVASKVALEDNIELEEKIGFVKRKRFEDVNTRVTTYIDKDQLAELHHIKREYNIPMTKVIYNALNAYFAT